METKNPQAQQYLKDVEEGKDTLASLKVRKQHNERVSWFMDAINNAKSDLERELKADYDGLCAAIVHLESVETTNP